MGGRRYRLGVGVVVATVRDVPGAARALAARSDAAHDPVGRLIVFFAGFMVSPWSYRSLFTAIVSDDTSILAPQMYRRGLRALVGHPTPSEEAEAGERIVQHVVADRRPREVWLAGHSRGGQVAWRIAERIHPDGVIVIDPVDGSGRHPSALSATAAPARFASRTLVVGAGRGGRCAPAAVNHAHFAAAAPPGASHVVVATMGHGDVLDDRPARAARVMCGGSADPGGERSRVAELIHRFVEPG